MIRLILLLLAASSEAIAHPGHGAALGHVHGWDWGNLLLGVAGVALVALAAWRAK